MAADLHVEWSKPIELQRAGKLQLALDHEAVPREPGVYMFFRRVGNEKAEGIYVGKGGNLRARIKGQMNNNKIIAALLEHTGSYFLMPGVFRALPGQTSEQALDTIERTLIRDCIEEGHPLINTKGARIHTRHVVSTLAVGGKFLNERIAFEPPAKSKKKLKAKPKKK